jgi:hypothetical protein
MVDTMTIDFQNTNALFERYAVGQELTREELNWLIFGLYDDNVKLRSLTTGVRMENVNTAGPIEISGVTVNR